MVLYSGTPHVRLAVNWLVNWWLVSLSYNPKMAARSYTSMLAVRYKLMLLDKRGFILCFAYLIVYLFYFIYFL